MLCRFLPAILACCSLLHAQQASTPEPQYGHQYNAVMGGQLVVLERQTAVTDTKSRRFFVITPSTTVFESINNPASPIRVGPNTHFLVRLATGDRDPQTLIHLQKLTPAKKDRQVPIVTYKASLIPGGGLNHKRAPDEPIPITIQKYGADSLEIIPQQPLEPGEYAFMTGHEAQCFGVDAGLSSGNAPSAPAKSVTPPPPPAWKIDKLPEISSTGQDVVQTAAILEGHSTIQGKTSRSYLVMHCGFPTTEYPVLLPLEVILGGTDPILEAPGAPGMPMDVSAESSSQIGNASAIHVNASGQNRTTGARVRFFYDAPDMDSIVNAAGQPLHLSIGSGSPEILASFTLPTDNAPLQQMMNACLQKSLADAEAAKAKTVAACPSKEGKILSEVALKYVDTGKDVKGDMDEMDNGAVWHLPPAIKGHAARKTMMTCSYRDAGKQDGSPMTDKASVPVPVTARTCNFTVHANELRNDAICLAAAAKNQATDEPATHAGSSPGISSGASEQALKVSGSPSGSELPSGPTAPVNRLNVRGISVRMGRGQILAAAKAANMKVLSNVPQQIKLVDPTASGKPVGEDAGPGGSGLVLMINMKEDRAVTIFINEQGDLNGHVFEDIQKKWGAPKGKDDVGPFWGDLNGVYADYDGNMYGFLGMHVTIEDKTAFPAPPKRQSVPM